MSEKRYKPFSPEVKAAAAKQLQQMEDKKNNLARRAGRLNKADQWVALQKVRGLSRLQTELIAQLTPTPRALRAQGFKEVPYQAGTTEFARYLALKGLRQDNLVQDRRGTFWEPPNPQYNA